MPSSTSNPAIPVPTGNNTLDVLRALRQTVIAQSANQSANQAASSQEASAFVTTNVVYTNFTFKTSAGQTVTIPILTLLQLKNAITGQTWTFQAPGAASANAAQASSISLPSTGGADIEFIIDGGGAAITTGYKGFLFFDVATTISQMTLLGDQTGSVQLDLQVCPFTVFNPATPRPGSGDSIVGSDPPVISNGTSEQDSGLTGWTTSISAGSVMAIKVSSVSTFQRLTLALKVTH